MSKLQSNSMKERWQDPEYRQKQLEARGLAPQPKGRRAIPEPPCMIDGPCFARVNGKCLILLETPGNKCSFQKERRDD